MCRVLVCGGRDFTDAAFMWTALDKLHAERKFTALIQGGSRGADTLARDWAKTKPEIARYRSRAKWTELGREAGPVRNARMLTWKPDLVVAFAGGRGTRDMIRQAKAAGVEIIKIGWT
jgi:hypothetical protein